MSSSSSSESNFRGIVFLLSLSLFTLVNSSRILSQQKSGLHFDDSLTFIWPLPSQYTSGNQTLTVDPNMSLIVSGVGGGSLIVKEAFERYKYIIFRRASKVSKLSAATYDVQKLSVIVQSDNEELQLGTDESYSLLVAKSDEKSIIGEVTIEANSVYGALRGLETLSQLCTFDSGTKSITISKAPWFIQDKPRFEYRGLLLDTSRHYYPVDVIKQIIESMSYAKLNVLHWHIIDEESFPLEVPGYPNLWKGAYSKWERYTVEDAQEIVQFAKMRGINIMAEVDVPGHAESWGKGYPDLWPSPSCTEPLDVSKNFTFEVISGLLADMRKIFPFKLFHLGGDEVNTDCWTSTQHVKEWLQIHNMTAKDAYQYFVLKAQEIALSNDWIPVNWLYGSSRRRGVQDCLDPTSKLKGGSTLDFTGIAPSMLLRILDSSPDLKKRIVLREETFHSFANKLNPQTVVHNWLGPGVCPQVVAKGLKCIFSNQGAWYLDHLDVTWDEVYYAEPLEGIYDISRQQLVLGGEVCMWSETADASNVLQTIWPRAAAAAERLWSKKEATFSYYNRIDALQRLEYFRCLLTMRGVQAAPVQNRYGRSAPMGPGSCYEQ